MDVLLRPLRSRCGLCVRLLVFRPPKATRRPFGRRLRKKNAAKRPETKEGGREEEKSRLGIASWTEGPADFTAAKGVSPASLTVMDLRHGPAVPGPGATGA